LQLSDFIKKILWPTDFSDEAQEALDYADLFARAFKAEILALHVVPEGPIALYNSVVSVQGELVRRIDLLKEDATVQMDRIRENKEIAFTPMITEGNASKEIIRVSEEEDCDLIVMGKKGLSALEKIFIGSQANQVLRNARIPLLLTKKRSGQPVFKKILVPTDFSEFEEIERDYAWRLAGELDADLMLLHVLELHDHEFSPRVLDEMMDVVLEKLRARKKREAEDIKVSEDVTRAVTAALGIVDYAETNKYDLIVISTCGPGAVERFFLGSTTEKVIHHSSLPVFALPSHYNKL
jgi:nucleotide-binding universal stress UspA family protein